ncbi:MAG: hypothetical protein AAFQ94_30410 [Bacteroidota bacterium]
MSDAAEQDLIDKFLSNDLSDNEQKDLKSMLNDNPQFLKEVVHQGHLSDVLKNEYDEALKADLLTKVPLLPERKEKAISLFYYAAAAVSLIFVSILVFALIQNNDEKDLISEYFEPYPVYSVERGETSSGIDGVEAYESGNYQKALDHFEQYGNLYQPDNRFNLVIGSSYLGLKQGGEAIRWFTPALSSDDKVIFNVANWNMALSEYLVNPDLAYKRFQSIAGDAGPYQKKAQAILKERYE